jgi:hypothetical protein
MCDIPDLNCLLKGMTPFGPVPTNARQNGRRNESKISKGTVADEIVV